MRTSPDHGTAFAIAGTGKARPDSFLAALELAAEIGEPARARAPIGRAMSGPGERREPGRAAAACAR